MAKPKYDHKLMAVIGGHIASMLYDVWDGTVAVVGSVRRGKSRVSDVELLVIDDAAGGAKRWLDEQPSFRPRLNKKGHKIAWGEKYRAAEMEFALSFPHLGVDRSFLVPVDFFFTDLLHWGWQMILRTGPADANKLLVTKQAWGGLMPEGFRAEGGTILYGDKDVLASYAWDTEVAVFNQVFKMRWVSPQERTPAYYQRVKRECEKKEVSVAELAGGKRDGIWMVTNSGNGNMLSQEALRVLWRRFLKEWVRDHV